MDVVDEENENINNNVIDAQSKSPNVKLNKTPTIKRAKLVSKSGKYTHTLMHRPGIPLLNIYFLRT